MSTVAQVRFVLRLVCAGAGSIWPMLESLSAADFFPLTVKSAKFRALVRVSGFSPGRGHMHRR